MWLVRLRQAEGGAAKVFQSTLERFGGAVRGSGTVEVGQDVGGPLGQGAATDDTLLQSCDASSASWKVESVT